MNHNLPNPHPLTPSQALLPTPQHELDVHQPEQEMTREAFTNMFDDLMLHNIKDVASYRGRDGATYSYAILEHETGDPHIELVNTGTDHSGFAYDPSTRPVKEIVLQTGGQYGDALTYRLYDDGVVRRYDTTFEEDYAERTAELITTLIPDENTGTLALDTYMDNVTKGQELERDLGSNNQPVGSDEIERLRDYIASLRLRRATAYAARIMHPYPKKDTDI